MIRNVFIILSSLIVLLHNLVPHDHHSDFGNMEDHELHAVSDDLIDPLLLVFHEDLSGSLDNVLLKEKKNDVQPVFYLLPTFVCFVVNNQPLTLPIQPFSFFSEREITGHYYHHLLRGPPAC